MRVGWEGPRTVVRGHCWVLETLSTEPREKGSGGGIGAGGGEGTRAAPEIGTLQPHLVQSKYVSRIGRGDG